MKMNKAYLKSEIKNRLNYTDEQVDIIANIMDEVFFIGKTNKEKLIDRYQKELNVSLEEATNIYEVTSKIIGESIKESITHPFRSIDDEK